MKALLGLFALLFGTSSPKAEPPAGAPVSDELVTGVVGPQGASGGRMEPAVEWTLWFVFESWRGADGIVRPARLTVRRSCTEEELRALMARIRAYAVISVRVRFTGADSAELLELVDAAVPASDPLTRRAQELAAPATRDDGRFGRLTLNRALGWWEATATWAGDTVQLQLSATDEGELNAALHVAGALWDDQAGWSERIEAFAVERLLPLKNESWLDENEDEVSPAAFRARMRLQSITVEPDGFVFWYDDGDLFWGHSIQVTGNLSDGPTDADIPG
ncbi:MAG TPA: DUF2262 domain-containing protein [Longimicrobiaceae bacterium]|nr:DUF2262 domain-containing protein [Longimicrobiaceae bacterium]